MYLFLSFSFLSSIGQSCFSCKNAPASTIFCDDFESDEPILNRYFEYNDDNGRFIRMRGVGRDSSYGMRMLWKKGETDGGYLHKAIGRSPDEKMTKAAFPEKDFGEIYWRIDLKNQEGWEGGGGDKLTRATIIAGKNWQQAMIAHIWSGGKPPANNYLIMDPASGINDSTGKLITTAFNDFTNLRWLGNVAGITPLFNSEVVGKWYCIITHIKLNSPGKKNGIFEFWINDTLQAGRYDLDWVSNWNTSPFSYGINAVFFENYWNRGSPKEQERYFDNILITTSPIQCSCSSETKDHKQ